MKIWVSLLGLTLCCLAASAQPTSLGGNTPGKTFRAELKSLVHEFDDVDAKNVASVKLKQPEGLHATVRFQNDVVYMVEVDLQLRPELEGALIEKYGQLKIQDGAIRRVTCKNEFGASSEGFEGKEERRWPAKDGVQGLIKRQAGSCAKSYTEYYVLRHVATVKAMENNRADQEKKEAQEKLRKLGGAF